ncbi:MAG TPA: hypothetical protein VIK64_07325, partial [Anaerolineales bacterium]
MEIETSEKSERIETTRLLKVEQELKTRLRQQEALTQIGQRALITSSLEELFDETVGLVAETLDVEYCKVLKLLPDDGELL